MWDHFTKINDGKSVKCTICEIVYSYTDGCTTTMGRHLLKNHDICIKDNKRPLENNDMSKRQPTLASFMNKKQNLDTDSLRYKEVTDLVLGMIVDDSQPFSMVEDEGFVKYTKYLEPRYVLPTRGTLRNVLLPSRYEKVKQLLLDFIKPYNSFSITITDGWTSRNTTSYVTYTLHMIDEQFLMHAYQLGTYELSESHTANVLCSHLIGTCQKWGIIPKSTSHSVADGEAEGVGETADEWLDAEQHIAEELVSETPLGVPVPNIYVTTDNAADITAAIRLANLPHVPCFAHTLNLAVQKALKDLTTPLSRVRKLVAYFHKSTLASKALRVSLDIFFM